MLVIFGWERKEPCYMKRLIMPAVFIFQVNFLIFICVLFSVGLFNSLSLAMNYKIKACINIKICHFFLFTSFKSCKKQDIKSLFSQLRGKNNCFRF